MYDKIMIEISHQGGTHGMVGIYGSPKTLNKINRWGKPACYQFLIKLAKNPFVISRSAVQFLPLAPVISLYIDLIQFHPGQKIHSVPPKGILNFPSTPPTSNLVKAGGSEGNLYFHLN